MFNSTVLDVAIGLTFVYLALALLCTALNEWWSRQLGLRGKVLQDGIYSLLGAGPEGNDLTKAFYGSPLIQAISGGKGEHPSYISPRLFAQALVDALKKVKEAEPGTPPTAAEQTVQTLVSQMKDGPTMRALQTVLLGADASANAALARISGWFDDSMDRVSGWYKRKIQFVTLIMAIVVTVVANADTLRLVNQLWANPTLRAAIVAQAQERAKQAPPLDISYKDSSPVPPTAPSPGAASGPKPILTASEKEALGELLGWSPELAEFNRRVGESERPGSSKSQGNAGGEADSTLHARLMLKHPMIFLAWLYWLIPLRIVGWAITVYAISLGAPFWFGVLQKLVNIRSAGDAPDEKVPGIIHP